MDKDKARQLQELLSSDGWQVVDEWLTKQDNLITKNIKTQLINLKSAEMDKWLTFYSGEATIIAALRSYIARELKREETKAKFKAVLKNPWS